jgi:hypothetical protein
MAADGSCWLVPGPGGMKGIGYLTAHQLPQATVVVALTGEPIVVKALPASLHLPSRPAIEVEQSEASQATELDGEGSRRTVIHVLQVCCFGLNRDVRR